MTVTPTLTTEEAMARLQRDVHEKSTSSAAMYASVLGGIVTVKSGLEMRTHRSRRLCDAC